MAWFYMLFIGFLEVAAAMVFRYTDGFSRIVPTISFFGIGIASFFFFYRLLDGISSGTIRYMDGDWRRGCGATRHLRVWRGRNACLRPAADRSRWLQRRPEISFCALRPNFL